MNDKLEELMYHAGLTAQGCWNEMDEYDRKAIEKFAELIVKECTSIALEQKKWVEDMIVLLPQHVEFNRVRIQQSQRIVDKIKEHFGVEEPEKVAPEPKCSVCGTTENVKYMGGYQPYLCDSVDCIPF